MRVYLAGPMRGYPYWNWGGFDRAEGEWVALGYEVVSPAQQDRRRGLEAPEDGSPLAADPAMLRAVIREDVDEICRCDAVALLPGWERSAGATVELALAQFLGLPIYDAETKQPLEVPKFPWRKSDASDNAKRKYGVQATSGWDQIWRDSYLRHRE